MFACRVNPNLELQEQPTPSVNVFVSMVMMVRMGVNVQVRNHTIHTVRNGDKGRFSNVSFLLGPSFQNLKSLLAPGIL